MARKLFLILVTQSRTVWNQIIFKRWSSHEWSSWGSLLTHPTCVACWDELQHDNLQIRNEGRLEGYSFLLSTLLGFLNYHQQHLFYLKHPQHHFRSRSYTWSVIYLFLLFNRRITAIQLITTNIWKHQQKRVERYDTRDLWQHNLRLN